LTNYRLHSAMIHIIDSYLGYSSISVPRAEKSHASSSRDHLPDLTDWTFLAGKCENLRAHTSVEHERRTWMYPSPTPRHRSSQWDRAISAALAVRERARGQGKHTRHPSASNPCYPMRSGKRIWPIVIDRSSCRYSDESRWIKLAKTYTSL